MEPEELDIFCGIEPENAELYIDQAKSLTYTKNSYIVRKGTYTEFVYFILDGVVKKSSVTNNGKEVVFCELKPGDSFALSSTLGEFRAITDVVAATNCKLLAISKKDFLTLVRKHKDNYQYFINKYSRDIGSLTRKLYELRAMNVSERIQSLILSNANQSARLIRDNFISTELPTHDEIANLVFSHREAITKEFNHLNRKGILIKRRQRRYLTDTQALEDNIGDLIYTF